VLVVEINFSIFFYVFQPFFFLATPCYANREIKTAWPYTVWLVHLRQSLPGSFVLQFGRPSLFLGSAFPVVVLWRTDSTQTKAEKGFWNQEQT
jgi:hypothetical protein